MGRGKVEGREKSGKMGKERILSNTVTVGEQINGTINKYQKNPSGEVCKIISSHVQMIATLWGILSMFYKAGGQERL